VAAPPKNALRIFAFGLLALLGLPLLVAVILGMSTPEEHQVQVALRTRQGPAGVWQVLADWKGQAQWRRDVATVETLKPVGDRPAWRTVSAEGDSVEAAVLAAVPPRALTLRLEGGRFSGTWTLDLVRDGLGTAVVLTERGTIPNPLVRLMAHRGGGLGATAQGFLEDLSARLGDKNGVITDSAEVAGLGRNADP
jgi:uncharacterized protein YndB with AHSA1/START domain